MKPEEAIERLEYLESALDGYPPETGINDVFAAIDTAIEALKEVQQYREIGTVEECREAVEKQKSKKCVQDTCPDHTHYKCPTCGKIQMSEYKRGIRILGRITNFCDNCGQGLESEK